MSDTCVCLLAPNNLPDGLYVVFLAHVSPTTHQNMENWLTKIEDSAGEAGESCVNRVLSRCGEARADSVPRLWGRALSSGETDRNGTPLSGLVWARVR